MFAWGGSEGNSDYIAIIRLNYVPCLSAAVNRNCCNPPLRNVNASPRNSGIQLRRGSISMASKEVLEKRVAVQIAAIAALKESMASTKITTAARDVFEVDLRRRGQLWFAAKQALAKMPE
jgi:hypothetical protein